MATKEAAQVVLDQARVQLADQLLRVDNFRTKGFAALAVSGTVAAFFAGRIAHASHDWEITGLVAFAVTALCAILIAIPLRLRHGIDFPKFDSWITNHGNNPEDAAAVTTSVALWLTASIRKNEGWVTATAFCFAVLCLALGLQFVVWLVILSHA